MSWRRVMANARPRKNRIPCCDRAVRHKTSREPSSQVEPSQVKPFDESGQVKKTARVAIESNPRRSRTNGVHRPDGTSQGRLCAHTNAGESRPVPVTFLSVSTGVGKVDDDDGDVMAASVNSNAHIDTAPPGNAWITLGTTPRNSVRHPDG